MIGDLCYNLSFQPLHKTLGLWAPAEQWEVGTDMYWHGIDYKVRFQQTKLEIFYEQYGKNMIFIYSYFQSSFKFDTSLMNFSY